MKENQLKMLLALILLIFVSIPIFTSSILDFEQEKKQTEIEQKILKDSLIQKKNEEDKLEKIYLMGKFNPNEQKDFVQVPIQYNINGYIIYLRKETLDSFIQMADTAEKDNIKLKLVSATRNFTYQKNLWNNKWEGITLVDGLNLLKTIPDEKQRIEKILEYSAAPGTSRHHWGTDIDINDTNSEYFKEEDGEEVYKWLLENASKFGFCQPYNTKGISADNSLPAGRQGYNEEKWHWSYIPLAKNFTQEYVRLIKDEDIKNFDGDQYSTQENLIQNYVLGINPKCL